PACPADTTYTVLSGKRTRGSILIRGRTPRRGRGHSRPARYARATHGEPRGDAHVHPTGVADGGARPGLTSSRPYDVGVRPGSCGGRQLLDRLAERLPAGAHLFRFGAPTDPQPLA